MKEIQNLKQRHVHMLSNSAKSVTQSVASVELVTTNCIHIKLANIDDRSYLLTRLGFLQRTQVRNRKTMAVFNVKDEATIEVRDEHEITSRTYAL